ncbi:MAG: ComF family protein [Lachnospiraceae bacterium]|nr:ComF family protein [Lachnospiraceae bacterium]
MEIRSVPAAAGRLLEGIGDIVYPAVCPVCGDKLPFAPAFRAGGSPARMRVHEKCRDSFMLIEEPYCLKCGKPVQAEGDEYCYDCLHTDHQFERGRSLWIYSDAAAASIFAYKYGGRQEYAKFYAEEVWRNLKDYIKDADPDILVPVPISPAKLAERGFNQAELIAGNIGDLAGIKTYGDLLFRVRKTTPQKELGRNARLANLRKAFRVREDADIQGLRIMLVDDVYTTGATADACSRALKEAGAEQVWVLTLCTGAGA